MSAGKQIAAGHLGKVEALVNRERGRGVRHDRILQYSFWTGKREYLLRSAASSCKLQVSILADKAVPKFTYNETSGRVI